MIEQQKHIKEMPLKTAKIKYKDAELEFDTGNAYVDMMGVIIIAGIIAVVVVKVFQKRIEK